MTQWLIDLVTHWGLLAVFVTMAAESAGVPISSENEVPLGGYLSAIGNLPFLGVVAAASLGNLGGSLVAFGLTKRYGERFLLGPGRRLGINRGHVRLANRFFNRYGVWAVFLGRLLPVIRTYISFPAGLSAIRLPIFVAATLAGAIPWNFALAYAGLKLGQHYSDIGRILGPVTIPLAILLLVLVGIAYWFGRRIGEDDGQLDAAPLAKHPS
jgi:membrane protein DedA with SNARE-associated domain